MSGINRYDSPAQDKYFNTYVPLPYEPLMGTVAARQAQLQREQDMLNKTYEDTQNLKYIPGSKDEEYVRDYLGKTSDLVNKYFGADLSDPIVKQQLRSQFAKMTDRQTIQNIQSSHAGWMQNQQYKAKLKAEGLYDEAIDEDPATGWDTAGSGQVYQHITSPFKNPRPEAEQYFNNIDDSDLGPSGDYNYSGVDKNKINSVADAKWNEFANTSAGRLYVKKIAKEQGLDYTNDKDVRQIATEYLKGVGEEFIRRKQGDLTLDAKVRASKKDEPRGAWTSTALPAVPKETDPLNVGDISFKDGEINPSTFIKNPIPTRSGYGAVSGSIGSTGNKAEQEVNVAESKARLDFVKTKFPQLKDLSYEDTYKAYKEITKDLGALPQLSIVNVSPRQRQSIAGEIANNFSSASMYIDDKWGKTDLANAQDDSQYTVLKDIGWSPAQVSNELLNYSQSGKSDVVRVSGLAPSAEKPGMVKLEVLDKKKKGKGIWRTLYVDGNEQFPEIMKPAWETYRNIEVLGGATPNSEVYVGYGADGEQKWARVIPDINYNGDSKEWEYSPRIEPGTKDQSGNFVPYLDPETDEPIETGIRDILDAQILMLDRYFKGDILEHSPSNTNN